MTANSRNTPGDLQHPGDSSASRAAFVADALASRSEARNSGMGYAAEAVHAYIEARVRGEAAQMPAARSWRD